MDTLSEDSHWQERIGLLAKLVCRYVPAARSKIAQRVQGELEHASVYRMFATPRRQPWTETVARCIVDLLIEHGLCPPTLWAELRATAIPRFLAALTPSHEELISPNDRTCTIHHKGSEVPAEIVEGNVEIYAGFMPPEVLTRALANRSILGVLGSSYRESVCRGIKCLANRRRKRNRKTPGIARRYFILESAVTDLLARTGPYAGYPWKPIRRWASRLMKDLEMRSRFQLALVDSKALSGEDLAYLNGTMHVVIGESLKVTWPSVAKKIGVLKRAQSTADVERDHDRHERIRSALTHEPGNDSFLDRFSELLAKYDPNFGGDMWDYDA